MGTHQVDLTIENRLPELARVVRALDELLTRNPVPDSVANDMRVAIDEVLANLISHGYPDGAVHQIDIRLRAGHDRLEAEVIDDGVAFNPADAPPPDLDAPLESRRIGGLGVHLVRNLVSELEYRRSGGRNCLRMGRSFE